jgi:ribosomal protein S18 acetylase RimI-like enzyme
VTLEGYDREAFGPGGLRTYDLAVMVEAGAVFLALVGDDVVGGCQLMRVMNDPSFAYVVGFYVRPAWQGGGLGRRFLQLVAEECRPMGMEGMILTVAPGNTPAIGLYLSAGFERESFKPAFYGPGEDRYLLRWRFEKGGLSGSV